MKFSPRPSFTALAATSLGFLLSAGVTQATVIDFVSTASSSSSNWTFTNSWIDSVVPADDLVTDIARFNQTSYTNGPKIPAARSIAGIQIGDGTTSTAALSVTGSTLSIGGDGIAMFANAGAVTVSNSIVLGANQVWSNNSSSFLTVTFVGGNFALEKSGTGTLVFNSALNTFSEGFTLNSGTVRINRISGSDDNSDSFGSGPLTLKGGAVASTSGTRIVSNAVTINGNTQLGIAETTGGIILAGAVNVAADSQVSLVNGGGAFNANTVTLNGNLTINSGTTNTFTSIITDGTSSHGITKTGSGILVLSNNNTYSGGTTLTSGQLWMDALAINTSSTALGTGTVTINGGTLDLRGRHLIINALAGSGGTIIDTASAATRTLTVGEGGGSGVYSGNFTQASSTKIIALTKTGTGTQVLAGTNAYTGNTLVSEGTLQFAKQVSLYNNGVAASWSTAGRIVAAAGATLAFNVGGTGEFTEANINTLLGLSTATGGFTDGSFLGLDTTNAAGGVFTFNSAIGDTFSGANSLGFVKLGTGTLTFIETLTFTGDVFIKGGTLSFQNASIANTANVSIAGGAFFNLDFFDTDTIAGLYIAGQAQAIGTYGAIGSGAQFESAFFTGDGLLNVTVGSVVPEPSTYALIGGAMVLLVALRRRKIRLSPRRIFT